jgi:GNAT superfamily N-acetyltransferase
LVAEIEEQIIAVARFYRVTDFPNRAEAAFTVADQWQARGIGSLLLERLAGIAWERNITSFEFQVLTDNHQMIKVLSRSRFSMSSKVEAGVFSMILSLAP